jgi:hypothetical protein
VQILKKLCNLYELVFGTLEFWVYLNLWVSLYSEFLAVYICKLL